MTPYMCPTHAIGRLVVPERTTHSSSCTLLLLLLTASILAICSASIVPPSFATLISTWLAIFFKTVKTSFSSWKQKERIFWVYHSLTIHRDLHNVFLALLETHPFVFYPLPSLRRLVQDQRLVLLVQEIHLFFIAKGVTELWKQFSTRWMLFTCISWIVAFIGFSRLCCACATLTIFRKILAKLQDKCFQCTVCW